MNISAPFIRRPVATTLLTAAIAIAGGIAFNVLPVSPLPQVDFPTISVSASLPGASAQIMASSVATPLERQFGHIAGITEMTSSSSLGSSSVTLQFDLSRNIDAAARDVEAGINAARTYLPANLPSNPSYRKVNPADSPIMIIGLTSDKYDKEAMYDSASTIMQQKLSQIQGVGQVVVGGASNLTPADFALGLHEVLEALEEQVVLMRLLGESGDQESLTVTIGSENEVQGLQSTSLVASGYGSGNQALAKLGVLGPTRMDYPTAMGAVRAVARYVGQILAES